MSLKKYFFIFLMMLSVPLVLQAQDKMNPSILSHLETLEGEDLRKAIDQYYDSVKKLTHYQDRIKAADLAFELTAKKDELAHMQSLLFRATESHPPQTSYFNDAFLLAEKVNDLDAMCNVEYTRGKYYLARKQYDSAVYHILRYKDLTKADIAGDGYQNIVEFLGDIYYQASLYEQAAELYTQIYEVYEKKGHWNYYRPYVMMNNLGQIALRNTELESAKLWFEKSLHLAESNLIQPYRENIIAYIRIKLAETAMLQGNILEAQKQLDLVNEFPENKIQTDVKEEWLFHQAKLYLKQNRAEKAANLAKQLLPIDSLPGKGLRFIPDIYQLLAQIEAAKAIDSLSVQYYQQYYQIEDSLQRMEHISRSMIILAQQEIDASHLQLQVSKKRIQWLIIASVLLLLIIVLILLLYRKLYYSKLELVRKSLPLKKEDKEDVPSLENRIIQTESIDETLKQKELIRDLEILMKDKKPYLEQGIGINDISDMLKTNRTYLSKAINNQLNTSFPNLMNEYRINEAIRLITSGYTKDHTQEALAKKSGFSSRNVFTNSFKKQTGVLPSFFISNYKKMHKEDSAIN